jgi:UDP-glucose 4-epimerase
MPEVAQAMAAALNQKSKVRSQKSEIENRKSKIENPLPLLPLPNFLARLAGEFGQLKWALTGKPQIMSRRKIRDLLLPYWTCSIEKAQRDFNFSPHFTLPTGLAQTTAWYRAHHWLPPRA